MASFLTNVGLFWSNWLWPIIQLIIGLGLVIFVHELGHFLVAKAVKIKVERFALGFGPRLAGIRRGETDYCINLLPLGGYVKMLGQEDFKPLEGEQSDPRAFNNKSVSARLAVVSAGVVMNVIFAAILFVIVCLAGFQQTAPVIGSVVPGSPAANAEIVWPNGTPPWTQPAPATEPATQASRPATSASQAASQASQATTASGPAVTRGLQPGDRILTIDGKGVPHFQKLFVKAVLADPDQVFAMQIEREVDGVKYVGQASVGVEERRSESGGTRLAFGLGPAADTTFDVPDDGRLRLPFRKGDRLIAIDGRSVPNSWTVERIERTLDGRPVTVTIERNGQLVDTVVQPVIRGGDLGDVVLTGGTRVYGKVLQKDGGKVVIRLEDGQERTLARKDASVREDELLDILGMIPRIQVDAVQSDSPADKAGLEPGDVIVDYADRGASTLRGLLQINEEAAGSGTTIRVSREGKTLNSMWVDPKARSGEAQIGIISSVDMANAVVAAVRPGSAAAKAKVQPGDAIEEIDGRPVKTWADVFIALKQARSTEVTLGMNRNGQREKLTITDFGPQVFDPGKYRISVFGGGANFKTLEVTILKRNPLAAISWGVGETWDFIVMTYSTIRGLMQRTVSTKEVIGPVGIGGLAIKVGREGIKYFIYFMAMISVSLAVMNFLPIPVVDGGLAVFLLVEKIRGKPAPRKVMNAVQMVGLALLLFVFVAVTWQDISRLIRNAW